MHLASIPGRVRELGIKCHCRDWASHFARCPRCRCVVARCATHGQNMQREKEACCA